MARAGVATLLTLLTVLFAGCAGGDAGAPKEGSPAAPATVQANAEAIPDAGTIRGSVVDETLAPIVGAQVALLDQELQASTDENGSFQFGNLVPGDYQVAAAALGYSSGVKPVSIAANEEVAVQFQLTQIEANYVEPYIELLGPYSWYFDCRAGNAALTGPCIPVGSVAGTTPNPNFNDKASQNFTMSEDVVDFVGEMRWQQGSFATSRNLRMSFSYEGRPNTHWWCTSTSPSPLQWHYNLPMGLEDPKTGCQNEPYCGIGSSQDTARESGKHEVPTVDHILTVYTNTPFGCPNASSPTELSDPTHAVELALQQRLEVVISLFHGEPKPEGYTGFPDG
jgi:hypothetical protein